MCMHVCTLTATAALLLCEPLCTGSQHPDSCTNKALAQSAGATTRHPLITDHSREQCSPACIWPISAVNMSAARLL